MQFKSILKFVKHSSEKAEKSKEQFHCITSVQLEDEKGEFEFYLKHCDRVIEISWNFTISLRF